MLERIIILEQGRASIDVRFDAVDKRFDGVDKRLDGVDKRLDGIDHRLDGIDHRLDGMDGRLRGVETGLSTLTERVAHLPSKGFIVSAVLAALAVIAALILFQTQIKAIVGIAS